MSVWLAGVVLEALRNADDQAVFEDVKVKSIMKVEKECDMNTEKLYYKNIQLRDFQTIPVHAFPQSLLNRTDSARRFHSRYRNTAIGKEIS